LNKVDWGWTYLVDCVNNHFVAKAEEKDDVTSAPVVSVFDLQQWFCMLILIENSFSAEKAILPAHYAPSDEN
jgi:protein associated with RNAse G/E